MSLSQVLSGPLSSMSQSKEPNLNEWKAEEGDLFNVTTLGEEGKGGPEIQTPVLFFTDIIVRLIPKHGLERVEVARDCLCQGKRYLAHTASWASTGSI